MINYLLNRIIDSGKGKIATDLCNMFCPQRFCGVFFFAILYLVGGGGNLLPHLKQHNEFFSCS